MSNCLITHKTKKLEITGQTTVAGNGTTIVAPYDAIALCRANGCGLAQCSCYLKINNTTVWNYPHGPWGDHRFVTKVKKGDTLVGADNAGNWMICLIQTK